ncbi:MAG: fibrillarin-like rRNA/tRNA 2'-O-methyltransferase [Aigarchaeota archaeon]|nr:fibrillarin-like rRNA/tRNA 2'-O-methyltransferase [Aigarchaeota archaeon]MDW8093269.1 fibrillarin-like rRNA/tRNA 2'-O-methyltransferase [Nitrososphaerota archaeon]
MTEVDPLEGFSGVFWVYEGGTRYLCTKNLDIGFRVYGERLFTSKAGEFREWIPYRSKLAAAILRGLRGTSIGEGSRVLYLGAATGTTVSHISDIVGYSGYVFAIDFAPRAMIQFLERVAKRRENVVPILGDARAPERYSHLVGEVDVVYCDVAQPEQASLLLANCNAFLVTGGEALIAIKSRSIDSTEDPETVYNREIKLLERGGARVIERVNLEPYERDHVLARLRYGGT